MYDPLLALSPLDGRYARQVGALSGYFSEYALLRYRVLVEVEYFIALSDHPGVTFLPPLTDEERHLLRLTAGRFDTNGAEDIKKIERRTNHDIKAVEYYLREWFSDTEFAGRAEGIHFGLTSEDVNNLAYALALRDGLGAVIFRALDEVETILGDLAREYAALPMLARTHGQPATPTTFGKELAVFLSRLQKQRAALGELQANIPGKLNGATGNYNAHYAAYPEVDWIAFSRAFVESLGLVPDMLTTQIEPGDSMAAIFHALARINSILLDFCQDMWRYISDGYFVQRVVTGEVGSSTMPHKVNPIQFENAEGNLEVANALLNLLARRLPVSRLQRDLSNSTVMRNIGVALGHALLAYQNIQRGLFRAAVNEARLRQELDAHPEVITEAIQTVLRREGVADAYDQLKGLSRGGAITREAIAAFVESLDVSRKVKAELLALSPENYVGLAEKLAGYADETD